MLDLLPLLNKPTKSNMPVTNNIWDLLWLLNNPTKVQLNLPPAKDFVLQVLIPAENCLNKKFSKPELYIWRRLFRMRVSKKVWMHAGHHVISNHQMGNTLPRLAVIWCNNQMGNTPPRMLYVIIINVTRWTSKSSSTAWRTTLYMSFIVPNALNSTLVKVDAPLTPASKNTLQTLKPQETNLLLITSTKLTTPLTTFVYKDCGFSSQCEWQKRHGITLDR